MPESHPSILHFHTKDITGQTFGRLTVVAFAGYRHCGCSKGRYSYWDCQCSCGEKTTVRLNDLRGTTQSCGCLRREYAISRNKTLTRHGMATSPEYRIWAGMIARCHNENSDSFPNYGARGIRVCAAWRADFAVFFVDMGLRPSPKHSIERLNNNMGYAPDNCVWALPIQQQRNRRDNRIITWNEIRMCITDWGKRLNMPINTLCARLDRGWSIEKTLTEPINIKCRKKNNPQ